MEVKEIIKKREELNSQIQELVNNFHKETDIPVDRIDVSYTCSYLEGSKEFNRKYSIEVKLENPFE